MVVAFIRLEPVGQRAAEAVSCPRLDRSEVTIGRDSAGHGQTAGRSTAGERGLATKAT